MMEKDELDNKSAEELFQDYIENLYALKPGIKKTEKFGLLVEALRDAFFAGMSIASVSEQDFKPELLAYATTTAREALNRSDNKGLVN